MPKTTTSPGLHFVKAQNFAAVPYLETSSLMATHKGRVKFSVSKPNVLVGPNGSGKSALLTALALRTLSYFTGETSLDEHFLGNSHRQQFWQPEGYAWQHKHAYLAGLTCETHNAPALYYRPGHIPGNETCVTTAMMTGYFERAKAHARQVEQKSSGQASQALLARVLAVLAGAPFPDKPTRDNWGHSLTPVDLSKQRYVCERDVMVNVLLGLAAPGESALPLVLMDEPEQSLDALAEAQLWKKLEGVDCSRTQVIVASHSLYPLLHPAKFNLIETQKGYLEAVRAAMAG